eukprot:COSAG06_NODE_15142_length_1095_cov_0.778112_1_plen_37_part_10
MLGLARGGGLAGPRPASAAALAGSSGACAAWSVWFDV